MGTIRKPRRLPYIADTIDYLRHCGADAIEVSQTKRIRIGWEHDGDPMSISVAVSTRNTTGLGVIAKQQVRRRYREAGIEVAA